MEKSKYDQLLAELSGYVPQADFDAALALESKSARVDAVQDLIREAFLKSSIGFFNGQLHFFGGEIYEPMAIFDLNNLVYDLLRKCGLPDGNYSRLQGIINLCVGAVSCKEIKPDNSVVIFRNGAFDVRTRELHPFSAKFVQVTSVNFDYDPVAYPQQWLTFLHRVLPSVRVQMVLQEFLGCIFVDRAEAKIEKMLVLRGDGANGKSVVFETVTGILGRENVSTFGIGALIAGNECKKNIATINGKRLNYCSEIQSLAIGRDSDMLKALISGEPIPARPIYAPNFIAYNIPLLMANANRMPELQDWGNALRRRICIIPFNVSIPKKEQHPELSKELAEDYPGIFNWIMEGHDRFVANGYKFTECEELEKAMDEYFAEANTVMRFMYELDYKNRCEDVIDVEPVWVSAQKLFRQYHEWCVERGETPETMTMFGRILARADYRKDRMSDGYVYGIYGQAVITRFQTQRKNKMIVAKTHQNKPYTDAYGRLKVETLLSAAYVLGIAPATLKYHQKIGSLVKGQDYEVVGNRAVYDVERCRAIVVKIKRGAFNERKRKAKEREKKGKGMEEC